MTKHIQEYAAKAVERVLEAYPTATHVSTSIEEGFVYLYFQYAGYRPALRFQYDGDRCFGWEGWLEEEFFQALTEKREPKCTCPRCGGHGIIKGFEHINGGRCYLCSGKKEATWVQAAMHFKKMEQRAAQGLHAY